MYMRRLIRKLLWLAFAKRKWVRNYLYGRYRVEGESISGSLIMKGNEAWRIIEATQANYKLLSFINHWTHAYWYNLFLNSEVF